MIQEVNVSKLIPHPRNNEFFDDIKGEKWEEFLKSIKVRIEEQKNGNPDIKPIIEPIIVTTDMVIVSGHQRIRACKELDIQTVDCEVRKYDSEDSILKDLIEINIRQRGNMNDSQKKVTNRINELERIYGIQHGGNRGNQYVAAKPNNSVLATQEQLAAQMGMSADTLQNYKMLTNMIPELEELVDTGIVKKTTALAMVRNLSEKEQIELISSLDTTKKITKKEVQRYINEINKLKAQPPKIIDNTDYEKISTLETKILVLETQKKQLELKVKLNQEEADKFTKLKSEIDFLTKQKSDLSRQIDSATELAGLTVSLQKMLENDLAPIKFKRCMEQLETSDTAVKNLTDIMEQIENWLSEMKTIIIAKNGNVIDVQ